MNKVLVVNGNYYSLALDGIVKEQDLVFDTKEFMNNPKEFKLVMFTGGEDVTPALYGHTSPKSYCRFNHNRDCKEMFIFEVAMKHSIAMTGICRGSQFLNVRCGGTLMHHIENHALGGTHTMATKDSKKIINVTSTHHQMIIPNKNGHIIAWSFPNRSNVYLGDKDEPIDYDGPEVEGIYYPKFKVFAVQYHPEAMYKDSDGYIWYNTGVKDLLEMTNEEFTEKYIVGQREMVVKR